MENELNSLQASSQNLIDENKVLNAEMAILAEKKEKLIQSLDWERLRSEKFSKENVTMKETVCIFKYRLNAPMGWDNVFQFRFANCS